MSERSPISSVQWKSAIYIVFFYGTFTRASKNYLDSATNGTFHAGGRVALSNAAGSSFARTHTLKKSKPIKEKAGTGERSREREREARRNESEIKKEQDWR